MSFSCFGAGACALCTALPGFTTSPLIEGFAPCARTPHAAERNRRQYTSASDRGCFAGARKNSVLLLLLLLSLSLSLSLSHLWRVSVRGEDRVELAHNRVPKSTPCPLLHVVLRQHLLRQHVLGKHKPPRWGSQGGEEREESGGVLGERARAPVGLRAGDRAQGRAKKGAARGEDEVRESRGRGAQGTLGVLQHIPDFRRDLLLQISTEMAGACRRDAVTVAGSGHKDAAVLELFTARRSRHRDQHGSAHRRRAQRETLSCPAPPRSRHYRRRVIVRWASAVRHAQNIQGFSVSFPCSLALFLFSLLLMFDVT